jgi:cell division protein FtsI (penicillin-binding protein 3)
MRPSLVEKITNEKQEVVESFKPEVVRRVISEETSKKVVSLLKAATEKGGTGEGAVPAGYEVAGKTGTAQKVESLFKEYSEDRTNAGFMGFVPPEDPKIVLLVVIDEPQGSSNTGGVVAAPVFKAIMEKVLPYLNVHPKGTLMVKNTADFYSKKEASWEEPAIDGVKVGKGAEKAVMPDLTGLPMRKALSRIEGKGLIIRFSGNGRVVEQNPRPGTLIEKGDICYLKFQSPI